jgi:hypothetical protein
MVLAAVVVLAEVLADTAVGDGQVLRDPQGAKEQGHGQAHLQVNHSPADEPGGPIAFDPHY